MALSTSPAGFPPVKNAVSYDFDISFVSDPNEYSSAYNLQQAIKQPLGSQFNLLDGENITSIRMYDRYPAVTRSSLERVMNGYNTEYRHLLPATQPPPF
jgi:hypothetical protein